MKQKFYEHLKENIDTIVNMFINQAEYDFDSIGGSSHSYYYLDYTSLDTKTIQNSNFTFVTFDEHTTPAIILLEIDLDDIFELKDMVYCDAVRQVILGEIEAIV
jgi:hypothetical protein